MATKATKTLVVGSKAKISANTSKHQFKIGNEVVVEDMFSNNNTTSAYVKDSSGRKGWVYGTDLTITSSPKKAVATLDELVLDATTRLITKNGKTTSLEVKELLRKENKGRTFHQSGVSVALQTLAGSNKFNYTFNGVHRVYTAVPVTLKKVVTTTVTPTKATGSRISRTKALELIESNKQYIFSATFTKKDGTERKVTARYLADQGKSSLGYVKVTDMTKAKNYENSVVQINLQTLKGLKIAGKTYKVNS